MKRSICLIGLIALLFSCDNGKYERADPNARIGVKDTLAIYLPPIESDSAYRLIRERITFSGSDTLDYLPLDRELIFQVSPFGELKKPMEHGKVILSSFKSSCEIECINDSTFSVVPSDSLDDGRLVIKYSLTFEDSYYFQLIRGEGTSIYEPHDTITLFLRTRELR